VKEFVRAFLLSTWPFQDPDRRAAFRDGRDVRLPIDSARLEDAALALFRWQRAQNKDYAAFSSGVDPQRIDEIPAVPVDLFRHLALFCFRDADARVVFRTSGTTSGVCGVHRLLDTEIYDLGAKAWFEACVSDVPGNTAALLASPVERPDSSLGHMVAAFDPQAAFLLRAGREGETSAAANVLRKQTEAVFVPTTGFSLADMVASASPIHLPEGSLLMITGGFKGRKRRIDEVRLYRELTRFFGAGLRVVGEYGMTELSSQLWTRPVRTGDSPPPSTDDPFRPPPWMAVIVVDPASGRPLPTGERGQLRFVDLANHQSVLAIETMDEGAILADGSVRLLGRLPSAPPRGCSLTVEEARG
jgi:hypothetical protein